MKVLTTLQELLNVESHLAGHQHNSDNFLVREGNLVHKGIIYIEVFYAFCFSIITFIQGYYYQSVLNGCFFVFSCLAYYIQFKGHHLASKLFNLIQEMCIRDSHKTKINPTPGLSYSFFF